MRVKISIAKSSNHISAIRYHQIFDDEKKCVFISNKKSSSESEIIGLCVQSRQIISKLLCHKHIKEFVSSSRF